MKLSDQNNLLGVLIFGLVIFFGGVLFAQYSPGDSLKIQINISSCPMEFWLDSLPYNPFIAGGEEQDTFILWWEYEGFHDTLPMKLKWETIYIVGSRLRDASGVPISPPQMQAILVINTGCPLLDFELSTYAKTLPGEEPWWEPNNTNEVTTGKYVLQALVTGYGTPRLQWSDTVRFKTSAAHYWVVKDTTSPQMIKDSLLAGGDICCFYSGDALGFDEIATIDEHGVGLWPTDTMETDTTNGVFFLHLALTTPDNMTGLTDDRLEGLIVLVIRAKVRE
ncbi:hypothetical protein DRQ33_00560 [bacterium]|nr:MAG: hypothetical protein DRQ33_00560 [bacterium]